MEQIIFGETTLRQLLIYAGAAVGALVVLGFVARLLRRSNQPKSCGWRLMI